MESGLPRRFSLASLLQRDKLRRDTIESDHKNNHDKEAGFPFSSASGGVSCLRAVTLQRSEVSEVSKRGGGVHKSSSWMMF